MAGPKEEWLIWDNRFQIGYSCLNQRLKTTEGAMQQFAQLDQQTKQLAASSKHLQEDNNGLRVKIQQIEQLQTSYRTAQLDEQIQELTASSRELKEQNNCLNDRILQLEQEGTHRDQENQLLQKQLKEKISVLDDELKSVVSAMSKMHETARAEPGKRRGAIQQSRSQVEAVVATKYTRGGHVRGASRHIPTATTEDGSMLINEHAEQQQQPKAVHQVDDVQGVLIKAQTSSMPFEDHLRYAEDTLRRNEAKVMQAFLSSVHKKYRVTLENKLEKHIDWTWQAAIEEGYKMVQAEKKIKRRSARLMAGPSQPS